MKLAAIGVRMHSGWGALVAVHYETGGKIEIIDRRRIVVIDPKSPGAKQPYHFAENMELARAGEFIENCFENTKQIATKAIRDLLGELNARKYRLKGAAVVLASGRPLPPLEKILSAHPLLHTAEGVFFREVFANACESCGLATTGVRERDLMEAMNAKFGKTAAKMQRQVAAQGRTIGPPWTTDQKTATLAALTLLAKK